MAWNQGVGFHPARPVGVDAVRRPDMGDRDVAVDPGVQLGRVLMVDRTCPASNTGAGAATAVRLGEPGVQRIVQRPLQSPNRYTRLITPGSFPGPLPKGLHLPNTIPGPASLFARGPTSRLNRFPVTDYVRSNLGKSARRLHGRETAGGRARAGSVASGLVRDLLLTKLTANE
jgi:hypothetical protein